jgi:hypothetical protein
MMSIAAPILMSNDDGTGDDTNVIREGTIALLDGRSMLFQIWSEAEMVYFSLYMRQQELEDFTCETLIDYVATQGFSGVKTYRQPSLLAMVDDEGTSCWNLTFVLDDGTE